jgi:hypothetical protein
VIMRDLTLVWVFAWTTQIVARNCYSCFIIATPKFWNCRNINYKHTLAGKVAEIFLRAALESMLTRGYEYQQTNAAANKYFGSLSLHRAFCRLI